MPQGDARSQIIPCHAFGTPLQPARQLLCPFFCLTRPPLRQSQITCNGPARLFEIGDRTENQSRQCRLPHRMRIGGQKLSQFDTLRGWDFGKTGLDQQPRILGRDDVDVTHCGQYKTVDKRVINGSPISREDQSQLLLRCEPEQMREHPQLLRRHRSHVRGLEGCLVTQATAQSLRHPVILLVQKQSFHQLILPGHQPI